MLKHLLILLVLCFPFNLQSQTRIPLSAITKQNAVVGQLFSTPSIYFKFNSSTLLVRKKKITSKYTLEAYNAIDSIKVIANILKLHPNFVFEIGVHKDCRGSKRYSHRITEERAKEVVEVLIAQGINRERLIHRGYEDILPLPGLECEKIMALTSDDEKYKAHANNRRLELKILKTTYEGDIGIFKTVNDTTPIFPTTVLKVGRQFSFITSLQPIDVLYNVNAEINHLGHLLQKNKHAVLNLKVSKNIGVYIEQIKNYLFSKYYVHKDRIILDSSALVTPNSNCGFYQITVAQTNFNKPFICFNGIDGKRDIKKSDLLVTGDAFNIAAKMDPGKTRIYTTRNIQFELDWLQQKLSQLDSFNVTIEVHTDCKGSESYNQALSERKAQIIKAYLLNTKLPVQGTINAVGKGANFPINICEEIFKLETDEEKSLLHEENERTTVRVLYAGNFK